MKFNAAVAMAWWVAVSAGAGMPLAAKASSLPATGAKASNIAAADADATKPVIEGITIPRKGGGFLGLTVEGVCFKLRFYDKDKKPVAPDVARAAARWNPANEKAQLRVILNPSDDGMSLVSPGQVRPPLAFRVFFTLFAADGSAVNSFWVTLSDSARAKE